MNVIGYFKRSGKEFLGEVITLSVQAKEVRIAPAPSGSIPGRPTHCVYVGRVIIGFGRPSNPAFGVLMLELDDPSFSGPISAVLREDDDSETYVLEWQRS